MCTAPNMGRYVHYRIVSATLVAPAIYLLVAAVAVLARRSLIYAPTILLALATVGLLWKFKKLQEPIIVVAAAVIGVVVYPLLHS